MKLELNATAIIALAGVATLGLVGVWLFKGPGAGLLSGDNALTRSATNADGERVTAYEGAGPLGTLGAAANAASGGYLSSFGQWLGGKAADLFQPDPMATVVAPQETTYGMNGAGTWGDLPL